MKKNLLKMSILMMLMFVFVAANAQNSSSRSTKVPVKNGTKGITGSVTSTNNYAPSSTMVLTFDVTSLSTDAEYCDGIEMTFPAGMTPIVTGSSDPFWSNTGCDSSASIYGSLNPITGQTISWGQVVTPSQCGWASSGTYNISVGVTIGAITGSQAVSFVIHGDGYGATPHTVTGNITVNQAAEHDLGIMAITPSWVMSGSAVTPTVTLLNHGANAEATWTVVLSDGGSYTSTKSNLSSIAFGSNLVVNMDTWTPANGNYTLTATLSNVAGDANATNNVFTQACSVNSDAWIAASGIIPEPTVHGSSADYFDGTNHYMYSFGGYSTEGNETSIYTLETDTWEAGEAMPVVSVLGCATTAGNFVYVLQGSDDFAYTDIFYRYDILADTWSALASLPSPNAWTQIAAVGGNIYCVGGIDNDDNIVSSVYRYNIATDAWTSATDIPVAHFGGSLTLVNGKLVYVMGIDANDDIVGTVYLGTIDGVNPDLISWTVGTNTCPNPVYRIKACPWIGNQFIVTGMTEDWNEVFRSSDCVSYTYDIVADIWQAITDKTTPTYGYAAASFVIGADMRYYVASGSNDVGPRAKSGLLDNVEYYTSSMPTGINDVVLENTVGLYPNPTQGIFTLELGNNNSTVTVYNLMGEVISSKENVSGTVSFDLSNVTSGIYLVKIVSDNKVIDKKVNVIH